MENSFQTSFIPKKPIASTSSRPSHAPTSIFTILAFLLIIIVGGASGGLFLYKNYLIKQKETLSLSLEKVRDSFEKDTIDELELYDKRVSASRHVLDSHIVLSPMFELLGNLTIPSIQYTKFDHQTNNQGFFVKMSGVALDYRSIALQADVFNSAKGRYFKNVVFSNLSKDKSNKVLFDVEFNVDPVLLSYEKNLTLEQLQAKAQGMSPTPVSEDVSSTTPAASTPTITNDTFVPAPSTTDTTPPTGITLPSVTNTPTNQPKK